MHFINMNSAARNAIVGGILCHFCYGTLYCWGTSTIYTTSYLRQFDHSIDTHKTLGVYGLALGGQAFTMALGGYLEKNITSRYTSILAILGLTISSFVTSLCKSISGLFFAQLLFGLALGVGYLPPMINGYKHLPTRRGFVSGAIVGGFGAGSFVFNFVILGIVNPTNKQPEQTGVNKGFYTDPSILDRVPTMWRILGCCYVLIGLTGASLQANYKQIVGASRSASAEESASLLSMAEDGEPSPTLPPNPQSPKSPQAITGKSSREMFKDPIAFVLMLCLFCTAVGGMYMATTFKSYGEELVRSDCERAL